MINPVNRTNVLVLLKFTFSSVYQHKNVFELVLCLGLIIIKARNLN